jgi:D-beta-D-heptose 7-phosphate kinase/D-beta-D-heptose 1-phosphate adenosyltransferase
MNENKRLLKLIKRFSSGKILVIGDIMLDEFVWGKVSRISPEAPVPVVEVTKENIMLGGAANVLKNIHALGGQALLLGVIGRDYNGEKLLEILKEGDYRTDGIIVDESRHTSIKTRVVAQHQQVVRFDRESRDELSNKTYKNIIELLLSKLPKHDAVIVSDYGKGLINRGIISSILRFKKDNGIIISVDPKIRNFKFYKGVTVITPNQKEAEEACGFEINSPKTLIKAGTYLLKRYDTDAILITRGEHGMSLFQKDGTVKHIPTIAKEVYDVTGAGDTVISALSLSLAVKAKWIDACIISNHAAGIVVGKLGTATASAKELISSVENTLE